MDKHAILEMSERLKSGQVVTMPEELREAARVVDNARSQYEAAAITEMNRSGDFFNYVLLTLRKPSHEAVQQVINEGRHRGFTATQIHHFIEMRLEDDRRSKKFIPKLEDC